MARKTDDETKTPARKAPARAAKPAPAKAAPVKAAARKAAPAKPRAAAAARPAAKTPAAKAPASKTPAKPRAGAAAKAPAKAAAKPAAKKPATRAAAKPAPKPAPKPPGKAPARTTATVRAAPKAAAPKSAAKPAAPEPAAKAKAAPRRAKAKKVPMPLERLERLVAAARKSLEDDKAEDVVVLDVTSRASYADRLIIATGLADRQIQAMAAHVDQALAEEGLKLRRDSVQSSDEWVLIDAGDLIIHLFKREAREKFDLEKMWGPDSPLGDSGPGEQSPI